MRKRVERPGVREGYDRWAASYDATPNPLVALDRRVTLRALRPQPGERVLDAGCGTGAHLGALLAAHARPAGLDLSRGMLRVARGRLPGVPLAQADLDRALPVRRGGFDVFLSALVSEHLREIGRFFAEAFAALCDGGRLVFSAFYPELAHAGLEANFEEGGREIRLGAARHTVEDYLGGIAEAGFRGVRVREHVGDEELARAVPGAAKYLGRPLLLLIEAVRPARD